MKENFADIVKANTAESELLDAIDPERVPAHVAIIMDGNGRWAKRQGKPRIYGHRAGSESVKAIIDTCARLEVKAVTLYAFSTENWKRPRSEVSGLMSMLKRVLRRELDQVHNNNIRFQTIGDIDGLSPDVQRELAAATEKTRNNNGLIMNVALNYGGRAEITRAAQLAMVQLLKEGREISSLTEADIDRHLFTNGLPEIDLLIRTSGEFRISNFLLWQIAYSEIYVTPVLFPDFRRPQIFEAIIDYQKRDRRFGGVK
ncbi:MAG TPA: isoprenyl transferase [Pyrinomonadaceae bacterium]|nr:isoprenyl transferase [Chloracidobacterium sp.]MBP9935578.1 isoprenyl transferase [Pyrinomonadaceae bacterium]MBK9436460.1 isoprenyl transferase [Chloracidobacterium sp.]MBK9767328.1 isoprenyl transferase [Chloracidobacterium sp.]MBL0241442.1 isoprenyl transferase [Chloracidobacterium sp.]